MPAPIPTAQMWHKAFWSMKERKRLADEYATGELERDKEKIKYASDVTGGREEAGDTRRFKHEGDMTFKQNQDRLRALEKEYQLRSDLSGTTSSHDLRNRTAEMEKQAALTSAAAMTEHQRRIDEINAESNARVAADKAKGDNERARRIEALQNQYKMGIMKDNPSANPDDAAAMAGLKARSALSAMEAADLQRGAGLNKVLIEEPKLGIPGYIGAETRRDLADDERAAGQAVLERLFPGKSGASPTLAAPAPGTRIKLGGGRKKSRIEELDETYNVR